MNWLEKIAALEDFLNSLGVQPEVSEFIQSQPDPSHYINQVKKNPNITLQELQQIQIPTGGIRLPNGQHLQPYTPSELLATQTFDSPFKEWALVQFRLFRVGRPHISKPYPTVPTTYDYYYDYREAPTTIDNQLAQIEDWWFSEKPEIASYSFSQAKAASDEWHAAMAAKGAGRIYQENNVVYGPQWQNEEWQGWTVQQILTENDLQVEGYRMNHCVADHFDEVESGRIRLFSLRDSVNKPHVTISMIGDSNQVDEIQGHSNSEPKDEYKDMVREWFESLGDVTRDDSGFEYDEFRYINNRDIGDALKEAIYRGDEYGIKVGLDEWLFEDAYAAVMNEFQRNNHQNHYSGSMRDAAEVLAMAAWDSDMYWLNKNFHRVKDEEYADWLDRYVKRKNKVPQGENIKDDIARLQAIDYGQNSQIHKLEEMVQKHDDEFYEHWHINDFGMPFPDESDYETEEEYNEAIEVYEKNEGEVMMDAINENLPYGFDHTMMETLNEIRKNSGVSYPLELFQKEEASKVAQFQFIEPFRRSLVYV